MDLYVTKKRSLAFARADVAQNTSIKTPSTADEVAEENGRKIRENPFSQGAINKNESYGERSYGVHVQYIKRARTRFISCLTVISRLYLRSHAHGKSRLRDAIVTYREMYKYPASHYRILPRAVLSRRIYNRSLARVRERSNSHDSARLTCASCH